MTPRRRRQHIILKEREVAIVFTRPESRLSLALVALNAATKVLSEGVKAGLISVTEGLTGFQRLAQSLLPIVTFPEETKED